MNNRSNKTVRRGIQLRGDIINIIGDEIYYRLYLIRRAGIRFYAINITSAKESVSRTFGRDKRKAYEIYEKIVRNTVTPCSLADIAEDFAAESVNKRNIVLFR